LASLDLNPPLELSLDLLCPPHILNKMFGFLLSVFPSDRSSLTDEMEKPQMAVPAFLLIWLIISQVIISVLIVVIVWRMRYKCKYMYLPVMNRSDDPASDLSVAKCMAKAWKKCVQELETHNLTPPSKTLLEWMKTEHGKHLTQEISQLMENGGSTDEFQSCSNTTPVQGIEMETNDYIK
jgi:hypothetical protein